jgi:uncharacterized membrane protein HdeD (DUF308 family)
MELLERLSDNRGLTLGITIGSAVMFAATLIVVPWLVARAPVDYFVRKERPQRSGLGWVGFVLKNLVGLLALVAGVLMLLLPGQGILTLLLGISLLDFPGKHELQQKLVKKQSVQKALSWMRRRAHKPEFELP